MKKKILFVLEILLIIAIMCGLYYAYVELRLSDKLHLPSLGLDPSTQTREVETMTKHTPSKEYISYVFVGDSRYRGMEIYAQDNDTFIAENGQGYGFLLRNLSQIKSIVDSDTALIIGLGVNDLANVDNYVETINELNDELDCDIYYMTVNPVDEAVEASNGYHIYNDSINSFNDNLKNELADDIVVIDTNAHLWDVGFYTMDGVHYQNETYEEIYNKIKDVIAG